MEIHPLLFISSPSYIDPRRMEESTSIFVRPSVEKIENALLEKQLQYFSKPMKEPRMLLFLLNNGEKIFASIDKVDGCDVLLNCHDTKRMIHANDIAKIHHTI